MRAHGFRPACVSVTVKLTDTPAARHLAQVAKGDNVKVGQLVATFTEGAVAAKPKTAAKAAAAPAAAGGGAPTQVVVPSMGARPSRSCLLLGDGC
jgi:hypothetical protein